MSKKLLFLILLIFQGVLVGFAQRRDTPKVDVRTFVTQMYFHGIPYEEAKSYNYKDATLIAPMLQDKSLEAYWQNIITTLGYIASPASIKPLINFIDGQKGEITVQAFQAVLSTFQALGHIAQSGNKEALDNLTSYLDLNSWKSKNLDFSYESYKGPALSEALCRQAIQGLGISGRPEALKTLKSLQNNKALRADWVDNVSEAVNLNTRIQQVGVNAVYRKEAGK